MSTDALARHLVLLAAIPPAPKFVDTATLANLLEEKGMRVTRRTLQRDLEKLAHRFPLSCRDDTRPFAWFWDGEPPLARLCAGITACPTSAEVDRSEELMTYLEACEREELLDVMRACLGQGRSLRAEVAARIAARRREEPESCERPVALRRACP